MESRGKKHLCGAGFPQCFTVYVPRVHVTVTNQASGESVRGIVASNFNATNETVYRWTASVFLAIGENRIVVTADDGEGNLGSDAVIIFNP